MPDGMARDVEDVEATVAEEVVRGVLADLGRGIKSDLMDRAASALISLLKAHQAPGERLTRNHSPAWASPSSPDNLA